MDRDGLKERLDEPTGSFDWGADESASSSGEPASAPDASSTADELSSRSSDAPPTSVGESQAPTDAPASPGCASPAAADASPSSVGEAEAAVERLCYGGESVVDAVPVSGGTVGVTSHRVLALTPDGDGPNLRAVDRPNVDSVELSSGGDVGHGARAVRFGVYALALVGSSYVVDFGSVSAVDPPSGTGAGQVVGMAVRMTSMLTLVDDVLRYTGLGVLVVALLFAALYGYSRDSYLAVDVAGDEPVRVPSTAADSAAVDRVKVALEDASATMGDPPRTAPDAPTGRQDASASVEKASNPSDG